MSQCDVKQCSSMSPAWNWADGESPRWTGRTPASAQASLISQSRNSFSGRFRWAAGTGPLLGWCSDVRRGGAAGDAGAGGDQG